MSTSPLFGPQDTGSPEHSGEDLPGGDDSGRRRQAGPTAPLFPESEAERRTSANPLFAPEPSPAAPLFLEEGASCGIDDHGHVVTTRSRNGFGPLFGPAEAGSARPEQPAASEESGKLGNPLFADAGLLAVPPQPVAHSPAPVMPPNPLQGPPKVAANPAPAFGESLDPLADRAWKRLLETQPGACASRMVHWKSLLGRLFPLRMKTLGDIGGPGLRHAPRVLNEIAQDTQMFAQMAAAETMWRIAAEAQAAAGHGARKGLSGLLSRVESTLHGFDPAATQARMIAMDAGLQGILGRLGPAQNFAQSTLEAITGDLPVLDVLAELSRGSPSEALVTRHREMLLTSVQQLRMALQQIDNLGNQCNSAIQSLNALRTVTLPALGFLSAIQS